MINFGLVMSFRNPNKINFQIMSFISIFSPTDLSAGEVTTSKSS